MRLLFAMGGLCATMVIVGCAGSAMSGRAVYDKHCVMCHGDGGHGDGDFSGKLLKLPPDLSVLTRENGGTFPALRVTEAIGGEGRGDHFSGAMPEFSGETGDDGLTDDQISSVVKYLETLQQ